MIHQKIKNLFMSSVEHVCFNISNYSIHPDIDFQRNRKISPQKLISFLVSQDSSSTKVEMLNFWGLDASSMPTSSADYYCSPRNSIRGVYSMYLNAFYDLTTHTYTDAMIQPVHEKMNLVLFVTWLTATRFLQEKRTSILVTVAIAPTTTWLMCSNKSSSFCSVRKISTPGA